MKWYWIAWSILILLCVLVQISILSEVRDHLKAMRLFSGGWLTEEEILRRGEGNG